MIFGMRYKRAEMIAKLRAMGLKRAYKPYQEDENDTILLQCRKPATIVDGLLRGAEIDVYDDHTVRVWTHKRRTVQNIAKANGFKARLLTGEAELYLPAARADEFLYGLGAKVKRTRVLTPEQLAKLRERFAKVRQDRKPGQATPQ
jgi:hypothetical protein